jgi:hypothetical protein
MFNVRILFFQQQVTLIKTLFKCKLHSKKKKNKDSHNKIKVCSSELSFPLFSNFSSIINKSSFCFEYHSLINVKIIDVETYQAKEQHIPHSNIDHVLQINGLFRLDAFSYIPGDCLFDAFHVLLHFRYSSIELRNGLIDHFLTCLHNGDLEAFHHHMSMS